jgi:hypothetical protein
MHNTTLDQFFGFLQLLISINFIKYLKPIWFENKFDSISIIHYIYIFKSWFLKRFKLNNLSFFTVDMYILTKGQKLEWHMYFLTNQHKYNGLFH